MPGIHHGGVERVLEEDGVQLVRNAVVHQMAIVPALETQAVGVDTQRPFASGRRRGQSEGKGADEVAPSHEFCATGW
jgi:hypothetical protein